MKKHDSDALATESTGSLLVRLSAPAMAGMFLISLYNVVDAFFVGRFIGPLGIAAIFILFPANLVVMAIAQAFGVGGASVISRSLGAKKPEAASAALGTVLSVGGAVAVLMGLLFWITSPDMVKALGGSDEIMGMATRYARIIFFGTPAFSLMMIMNNLVRGEGNTHLSMMSMAISSLTNIVLDPLFIYSFGWGIAGAAWATVLSQLLALCWLLWYYVSGKSSVKLNTKCLNPSLKTLFEVLRVGSSAFIRQSGFAFSWAILNRIFASTGGDMAVAISGIVQRMMSLMTMPVIGMGHGLLPIIGYNYGARRFERVFSAMRSSIVFASLFCSVCAVVMLIFPAQILSFFSDDPAMLVMGVPGARLVAVGIPFFGSQVAISTFYQATGKGALSFLLSMLRPLILHPLSAVALASAFGLFGTWLSFPFSDLLAFAVTWALYVWTRRSMTSEAQSDPNLS